jgi:hypothetical protein
MQAIMLDQNLQVGAACLWAGERPMAPKVREKSADTVFSEKYFQRELVTLPTWN